MQKTELIYNIDDIDTVVKKFSDDVSTNQILTFTGNLGAGKTTFISRLLNYWGVAVPVVSPTFTYMNVYQLHNGKTAYHFDLYRLDDLASFEQAGFAEYLYQENSICLIEWPEIILPLIRTSVCHVSLEFIDMQTRKLSYTIK